MVSTANYLHKPSVLTCLIATHNLIMQSHTMTTNKTTPNNTRFFGYAIEPALYQQVINTINEINQGQDTKHLGELAAAALIAITDAGFNAYYERPAQLAHISPRIKKATDAGIHTVQKGIHLVIRKLMKNRSHKDLKMLAGNLAYLICVDNKDPSKAYSCFRLEENLYQKVVANMRKVHEDQNVDNYRQDIIESVEALITTGIDNFYTIPTQRADIGRITRKAADIGVNAVHKGINAVVHRLFKDMDHATLLPMAEYFEMLLHDEVLTYKHYLLKGSAEG